MIHVLIKHLFFSGDFPTLKDLQNAIDDLWNYSDISVKPVSPQTYGRLEDYWREQYRDDIVRFLRGIATKTRSPVSRSEINAMIKSKLKPVWHRDTCDISCLVLK